MTRPSLRKFLLSTAFVLALAGAFVADANAATRPHRTEAQASHYIEKRLDGRWSSMQCLGDKTDRPGTDLYRSFVCLAGLRDTTDDETGEIVAEGGAAAYRLDTRPHGRWAVRVLR